ncbi:hypothetical protein GCM10029992_08220 [Glycomyces albus]
MLERLKLSVERYDAGDAYLGLNVITSGVHDVRQIFDLMQHEGQEAAENIAARLAAVPDAFKQYTETLRAEAAAGRVASKRQVLEVARHCDNWNGANGDDFWAGLIGRVTVDGEPITSGKLKIDLGNGAAWARAATTKFANFLREELAPQALRRTRSDGTATHGRRGTSSGPRSTSRRPTSGAGTSWPGSRPTWRRRPGRSSRARRWPRRWRRSTPTPTRT